MYIVAVWHGLNMLYMCLIPSVPCCMLVEKVQMNNLAPWAHQAVHNFDILCRCAHFSPVSPRKGRYDQDPRKKRRAAFGRHFPLKLPIGNFYFGSLLKLFPGVTYFYRLKSTLSLKQVGHFFGHDLRKRILKTVFTFKSCPLSCCWPSASEVFYPPWNGVRIPAERCGWCLDLWGGNVNVIKVTIKVISLICHQKMFYLEHIQVFF